MNKDTKVYAHRELMARYRRALFDMTQAMKVSDYEKVRLLYNAGFRW